MGAHVRVPYTFVKAAEANPWGLTPMECYLMKLACDSGGAKAVWAETGIPIRSVQDRIQSARARMGLRSHDCRVYILFNDWFRDYASQHAPRHQPNNRSIRDGQPAPAMDTPGRKPTTTWRQGASHQPIPRCGGAG